MDKKPVVKSGVLAWRTEDFSEYWKLIGLSQDDAAGGNLSVSIILSLYIDF